MIQVGSSQAKEAVRSAAFGAGGELFSYDQWNYFHQQALGCYARAFEPASMGGLARETPMTLDQFWAAAFGSAAAVEVSKVSNAKASKWWQIALGAAGSYGIAVATNVLPQAIQLIPPKYGWAVPVASMLVQGILAQRNLKHNPDGTPAAVPFLSAPVVR